jgi:hypothetical protein
MAKIVYGVIANIGEEATKWKKLYL